MIAIAINNFASSIVWYPTPFSLMTIGSLSLLLLDLETLLAALVWKCPICQLSFHYPIMKRSTKSVCHYAIYLFTFFVQDHSRIFILQLKMPCTVSMFIVTAQAQKHLCLSAPRAAIPYSCSNFQHLLDCKLIIAVASKRGGNKKKRIMNILGFI